MKKIPRYLFIKSLDETEPENGRYNQKINKKFPVGSMVTFKAAGLNFYILQEGKVKDGTLIYEREIASCFRKIE